MAVVSTNVTFTGSLGSKKEKKGKKNWKVTTTVRKMKSNYCCNLKRIVGF